MADHKNCKYYADCDYRNDMGCCPDRCVQYKHKDDVRVVRCKDCKHYGGITFGNVCRRWSAPLAGMKNCTKEDDFCSYGERRSDV